MPDGVDVLINLNLYRNAVPVDSAKHAGLRLARLPRDWSLASGLNAVFVATAEFGDACSEYPLLFVDAGKDEASGRQLVAPIAALGLVDKQNLFVEGGQWRTPYVPAMLRAYPFGIARADDGRAIVVLDEAYEGWSTTEGELLFDAEHKPTALLEDVRQRLDALETEIQRTRAFGGLLVAEGLLQPMRFDAELPGGQKLAVEGFMTVDEKKFAELPDAKVVEFHRNGVIALIHAHQMSLRHMRRLVEWHVARLAAAPAAQG